MRAILVVMLGLLVGCGSPVSDFTRGEADDDDDFVPEDDDDATLPPIEEGDWLMVSAGDFHSCGIDGEGVTQCWGWSLFDQTAPPEDVELVWVGAGWSHTCGYDADGVVHCWGLDGESDWGQGDPPEDAVSQLMVGSHHNCGLDSAGAITECWGRADQGQIEAPAGTWQKLDGSKFSSCGLTTGGSIECWGESQAGEGDAPSGTFSDIALGEASGCALDNAGGITCWGLVTTLEGAPAGSFEEVACGKGHCCALDIDARATCWGLGDAGRTDPPDVTFKQMSCGSSHCCGVASDGLPVCWGSNDLPEGGFAGQSTPPAP